MPGSAGAQLSQSGHWGLEDEVLRERAYLLLPLAGLKSVARNLPPFRALSPCNWTSARYLT